MKQLLSFIKKEFYHILRDRRSLLILIGMPITQVVMFGFAITNEVKNAEVGILDFAQDEASHEITAKIEGSRYFDLVQPFQQISDIESSFKQGKAKIAIILPAHLRYDLLHQNKAQIQIIADATDPNNATTLVQYAQSIIMDYQSSLTHNQALPLSIGIETSMLYNPQLKGAYNFVPGVMAMVLLLISAMMTSIAIVREKEMGTMEILLVSPSRSGLIILSKVIPFMLLSFVNVISILLISVFALEMPIQGSLVLLLSVSALYIFVSLALGILISTITQTQQTAMLISMMGLMLPVIMLSGYMFPIENMPIPLQVISNIVPAKWYIIIVKAVMIKGLGITAIWKETLALVAMALFFTALSIKNLKIRLA